MKATKENNIIGIGSVVEIYDCDLEEKSSFSIVSIKTGKPNELSFDCALGKSLLGKTVGEKVVVKADEEYEVKILTVDNSNIQVEKTYRNIFFCFQGDQYQYESKDGYIFALPNKGVPSWERLKNVKEEDIIFHCDDKKIKAIGIVKGMACICERPKVHYKANPYLDKTGLRIEISYDILNDCIITSNYKKEIIAFQGDPEGKGYPFNKNGGGNQGYLFNLNKSLAKFFMQEIIKRNPFMKEKDYAKDLLQ